MSVSQNTHDYDGKLKDSVKKILDNFTSDCNFTDCINQIRQNAAAINYIRLGELNNMLNLFANDKKNNFDPTNQANVEDLLCRLWKVVRDRDNNYILMKKDRDILAGIAKNNNLTDCEKAILLSIVETEFYLEEHRAGLRSISKNNKLSEKERKELLSISDGAKLALYEQVADITNGTCAQGRCTRLIQLFTL
jgi:hypothetical protein